MKKTVVVTALAAATAVAVLAPAASSARGETTVLSERNGLTRWAHVLRPVSARVAPSNSARTITVLSNFTPEGTRNLVLALESRGPWVRVRLAVLPNGTTAMVMMAGLCGSCEREHPARTTSNEEVRMQNADITRPRCFACGLHSEFRILNYVS